MGSFIGHIDEAIFFLALGVWWMHNSFRKYNLAKFERSEYCNTFSYGLPCRRSIPIEAILKILFPLVGLIGELGSEGIAFIDKNGNFRKLEQMQHVTIYGMFILHGLVDLGMSLGVPLPSGFDYLSGIMCFLWYGMGFIFHSNMPGKEPLEAIVHILPTIIMFTMVVAGALECWNRKAFLLHVIRIYCILVLGSWFVHVAFILYQPFPLPGSERNPSYDRNEHRNVHFAVAAFGFHCCIHMITIAVGFLVSYVLTRKRYRNPADDADELLLKEDVSFT